MLSSTRVCCRVCGLLHGSGSPADSSGATVAWDVVTEAETTTVGRSCWVCQGRMCDRAEMLSCPELSKARIRAVMRANGWLELYPMQHGSWDSQPDGEMTKVWHQMQSIVSRVGVDVHICNGSHACLRVFLFPEERRRILRPNKNGGAHHQRSAPGHQQQQMYTHPHAPHYQKRPLPIVTHGGHKVS
eukprot:GHVO01037133.1.p2 GENE.GHVO01037133.1~~GHVO01037133.1.p2  ORF type:complete len:187 (+),score=21.29 GHVO01037133.1:57-617(+)